MSPSICYEADRQKPAGDNVSQPNPQEQEHLQESRATNKKHYTCASQEQDHIEKVLPGAKWVGVKGHFTHPRSVITQGDQGHRVLRADNILCV